MSDGGWGRMGTVTMAAVVPQWYRMEHAKGGYAASYDWRRRIIMFVNRGGTAYVDLAEIEAEMQRREAERNQPPIDTLANGVC